jgi:hypothetical protein
MTSQSSSLQQLTSLHVHTFMGMLLAGELVAWDAEDTTGEGLRLVRREDAKPPGGRTRRHAVRRGLVQPAAVSQSGSNAGERAAHWPGAATLREGGRQA